MWDNKKRLLVIGAIFVFLFLFLYYPGLGLDSRQAVFTAIISLAIVVITYTIKSLLLGRKDSTIQQETVPISNTRRMLSQFSLGIGLLAAIMGLGFLATLIFGNPSRMWSAQVFYGIILSVLGAISVILIFVGLLLRTRNKIWQSIFFFLLVFVILFCVNYPLGDIVNKIAASTKMETFCSISPLSGSERAKCYVAAATAKKNLALCDRIIQEDAHKKYQFRLCYIGVAKATGDESICEKIKENRALVYNFEGHNVLATAKSICYANIAKERKSPELCAKIETEEVRSKCYEMVR
jgi:hypothetical protein